MERELHPTIQQFIKIRETCIFCRTSMRVILSNFLGLRNTGMPLLNSPIKDDKITFIIDETTEIVSVKATGIIDVTNNNLTFKVLSEEIPDSFKYRTEENIFLYIGEKFAEQAFSRLSPHIQIYCPNKKCKLNYYLSGDIIKCQRNYANSAWQVKPFLLFQETFATETLWVQNDWIHLHTNIYPLHGSPHVEPIKVPLMDFKSIDKQKLLTRVKTLVTFS